MGTAIEMDRNGSVRSKCKIARQVWYPFLFHYTPPTHTHARKERPSRFRTCSTHSPSVERSLRETQSANSKRR